MMLLVSAGNLTIVYVGLELLALGSYALVAIDRDNPLSSEAAMKYFVLGSLASGLLLFGMSLLYGATYSLDLATIHDLAGGLVGDDRVLMLTGVVFIVVRSEEHTSELQSLMRISYAVFCLKQKNTIKIQHSS